MMPATYWSALKALADVAASIPGAIPTGARGLAVDPERVIVAAEAELAAHIEEDRATRAEAEQRARRQLREDQQLFGDRQHRQE
jgi:hypothetical protein